MVSVEELQKSVEKIKKGEVKPQEPPQVTCTTELSSASPPSSPRFTMVAHQEPSARIGEAIVTAVQTVSTPPATEVT